MTHNNDDPAPVESLFAKERRLRRGWLDSEILRLTQERDGWRAAYEAQQPSAAQAEIERLSGELDAVKGRALRVSNAWADQKATIAQLTAALEAQSAYSSAAETREKPSTLRELNRMAIQLRESALAAVRDAKVRPTFMDHADEALASLRDAKGADNA